MAISLRINPLGDRDKAHSLIPFAVNTLLADFKTRMSYGGLRFNSERKYLPDGTEIRMIGILHGLEPMYFVDISCPIKRVVIPKIQLIKQVYLYLITVETPSLLDPSMLFDDSGKLIYVIHPYKLEYAGNIMVSPEAVEIPMEYIPGWNFTCQHGPTGENTAWLTNSRSPLGRLDAIWRAAVLTESPDRNVLWGESDPDYEIVKYYGANKAPFVREGVLEPSEQSRESFVYNDSNERIRYGFSIARGTTANIGYWGQGQALMLYRLQFYNAETRSMFDHFIQYYDSSGQKSTFIGSDYEKNWLSGLYEWKYYVPIIAMDTNKVIMRDIQLTKPAGPCGEKTYLENFYAGILTTPTESITWSGADSISDGEIVEIGTMLPPPVSVSSSSSLMLILDGCSLEDTVWSITKCSQATISATKDTGVGAWLIQFGHSGFYGGPFTLTASCTGCGFSDVYQGHMPSTYTSYGSNCEATAATCPGPCSKTFSPSTTHDCCDGGTGPAGPFSGDPDMCLPPWANDGDDGKYFWVCSVSQCNTGSTGGGCGWDRQHCGGIGWTCTNKCTMCHEVSYDVSACPAVPCGFVLCIRGGQQYQWIC